MRTSTTIDRIMLLLLWTIPLTMLSEPTPVHGQVQCWAARQHEGPVMDKRASRHVKAMTVAEAMLRQSQEFVSPPVPVRMRATMGARVRDSLASRLIVRAYPEKASLGIDLWQGDCGLIPQVDRVTEAFGQISIFINDLSKEMFLHEDERPKLTGTPGGYPEYNGWVIISVDGRLPWIPQTLRDRLDRIGTVREKALAEWQRAKSSRKAPDQAAVERTAALLRKTDKEGADKYVANMKRLAAEVQSAHVRDTIHQVHLTKLRDEYRAYRSAFTAEQLAMPAVWADMDGSAKKTMETQIDELQELGMEDQQRVGELRERSRSLEREAVASGNEADAHRLRAQSRDLLEEADHIRRDHTEQAALKGELLRSAFELSNLKPGSAGQALAYKMDPAFPDRRQPGKIQVIAVSTLTLTEQDVTGNSEQEARKAWLDRVKSSIDYAALAALLD